MSLEMALERTMKVVLMTEGSSFRVAGKRSDGRTWRILLLEIHSTW